MILSCLGVLVTDGQTDRQTDTTDFKGHNVCPKSEKKQRPVTKIKGPPDQQPSCQPKKVSDLGAYHRLGAAKGGSRFYPS